MPDDYYSTASSTRSAKGGPSLRMLLGSVALAFIAGVALVGYLLWDGKMTIKGDGFAVMSSEPAPSASATGALTAPTTAPAPLASASATPVPAATDQRIGSLEQRLARLDLQAAAAEGNAARAEGLLVAFAARRALDRGVPLGTLEDQLRLRFADAQPNAVKTVIDAAHAPVTLDQLVSQIKAMQDKLTATPAGESGWQRVRREITGLFVIRHDDAAAVPADRIDHAALLLREGRVDDAIAEIARLPGAGAAAGWIAAAKRYAGAQQALDLIESTALLDPHTLHGADGRRIDQPSPLAAPTPEAAAP